MDGCVCQYKIKRWTTEHKTFAEVQFYNINLAFYDKDREDFESMAFHLLRSFSRVERATEIEEGELYIRRRNGQKEFLRKRKSTAKHTEMCKCSHGYEQSGVRRSSVAQRELDLVARQQKLQAELVECREREQQVRAGVRECRPDHYSRGMKLKFDFELEEREPAQYQSQTQHQHHQHEHVHHHRRVSHHHHHHVHYERRPSYVRERPVPLPVRRPSYCDDTLLYQRVAINRGRRSIGGCRLVMRNYLHQQPEVVRYEDRSPSDYC